MEQNKEKDKDIKKGDGSEKKDEIEDIVLMDENDKMDGNEIIKLDENLKKYIDDKIFVLNDKWKLNLKILYCKISKKKALPKLNIYYLESYAYISFKKIMYIFFYKLMPVEVKLIFKEEKNNKTERFSICSTYELLLYCKNNNYNPYIQIENNKYEFERLFDYFYILTLHKFDKIILTQDFRNYDDFEKDELQATYPGNNSKLEPGKLSKFFDLFFPFEKKSNFNYWDYDKRRLFIVFISSLNMRNDIYCFKICGPSAIGKSMTLFLISKFNYNILYYNLKAIKLLKQSNDYVKIQNIITESCKYLLLDEMQVEELSSILKKNRIFSFFISLQNIVQFLIKNNI